MQFAGVPANELTVVEIEVINGKKCNSLVVVLVETLCFSLEYFDTELPLVGTKEIRKNLVDGQVYASFKIQCNNLYMAWKNRLE